MNETPKQEADEVKYAEENEFPTEEDEVEAEEVKVEEELEEDIGDSVS